LQFGIHLGRTPQMSPAACVDYYLSTARLAEELRFASVWIGDHILFPRVRTSTYPMTLSGQLDQIDTSDNIFEALTLISSLAAVTTTIKLGTNVLVLPYRHPLLTAKMLATIDTIAAGRLILGVGVGWLQEEFNALHAPSFEHRGALTDEHIRILRELWAEAFPAFSGRWYSFSGFGFAPKPVHDHIPIWIGGVSEAALRRTARLGDGWLPSHLPVEDYRKSIDRLKVFCAGAGRSLEEVTLALFIRLTIDPDASGKELQFIEQPTLPPYFRGNAKQIARAMRGYADLGISHVAIDVAMHGVTDRQESVRAAMATLAEEVVPSFGAGLEPSG
jgi:probable F420-dependent oxidoreductase